jgi:diacylglycerol kinase (ATP)
LAAPVGSIPTRSRHMGQLMSVEDTSTLAASLDKRVCLILNPHARRGVARGVAQELTEAARAVGWTAILLKTNHPGHEVELAKQAVAEGWTLVVAVGGDGTVHGVANALLATDSGAVLGHIPIGTGNDFAKTLGLHPRKAGDNLRHVLTKGVVRRFDVGLVANEYFINGMGVGFGAEVVRQALNMKRLKGFLLYLAAVYKTFWRFEPPTLEIVASEHSQTGALTLLEIAIGTTAGGGFKLTPAAEPDDGLFDVCVIDEVSVSQFIRWVPRCIKGTHVNLDPVTMFQTPQVTVTNVDRPLVMHLDGELRTLQDPSVTVELVPRCLATLCAS